MAINKINAESSVDNLLKFIKFVYANQLHELIKNMKYVY